VEGVHPPQKTRRRDRGPRNGGLGGRDAGRSRAGGTVLKALPASEPNPPFPDRGRLGHTIELYADFTRQGRTYVAFPDALTHRIRLPDLTHEAVRERLRLVWTDPLGLDPVDAREGDEGRGARLASSRQLLEKSDSRRAVAQFLMRCLFTFSRKMLVCSRGEALTALCGASKARRDSLFPDMVRSLWETMKRVDSRNPRAPLLRFNGGLFENPDVLPITRDQLDLLIEAGEMEWRDVEPAIFGTLLERAWTRSSGTSSAPTTTLAPMSNGSSCRHHRAVTRRLAKCPGRRRDPCHEGKLSDARDEVREFLRSSAIRPSLTPLGPGTSLCYPGTYEATRR